ncbi:hypothetical protein OGAPHI_006327 [Ogataea philodendri]|uniref:Major facilitator superfamily (MFS) profile domain-containing protein n=1 Tax=Ogataea philodendri TaxID=1378263 RepID=A0A9P8NXT5_9ASCO|nr:uncharacterized protein OGAPHI_006327 [Ogataea philodendri]KAH3661480.1 hypothetical protein OGAPHI_006327 [Ogataea philodendri]
MSVWEQTTKFITKYRNRETQNADLVLVVVLIGVTFDLINVTATISSIANIRDHFNTTDSVASWALSSYAVTFSGLIAFCGRIGDIVGHDTLFICSSLLFSLFSLLCAVVDNLNGLIAFRALQGVAAAALVPTGYAIVSSSFPEHKMGSRFSILAAGFSVSFGVGYIVGGALDITSVGYKGIYYLSCGVMFLNAIASFFLIKKLPRTGERIENLDAVGSLLLITATALIVVGFTEAGDNWNSPRAYVPLPVGVVLYVVFFFWSTHFLDMARTNIHAFREVIPLIPKSMLTSFVPVVMNFCNFANYASLFGMITLVSQFYQYAENNTALISALRLIPNVITMTCVTLLLAIKHDILSQNKAMMLGYSLMVASLAMICVWDRTVDNFFWRWVVPLQIISSAGSSFFFPHCLNVLIGAAEPEVKGLASGVLQTFGQLGVSVCFAVVTSVLGNGEKTDHKFRITGYVLVSLGALGWLGCLGVVIWSKKTKIQSEEEVVAEK